MNIDLMGAGSLVAAFDEVVRRHPDRPAVTCGDEELTYAALATRVARLAAALRAAATDPTRPVVLLLPRSADMVAACLAVLRTGSSYVPVDPTVPPARVALIVADSAASLVLTVPELAHLVPPGVPTLTVADAAGTGEEPAGGPDVPVGPQTRAYVIYTSGTTGRPKGVEVSHGNVLRLFTTTRPLFGWTSDDVWSLFHSFAFDFSVWEMYGPLLSGGRLVVVPREVARDPVAFRALLAAQRVTMLSQTPTAFGALVAHEVGHPERLPLKWVVFGGEALRFADLRPWVDRYGDDAPHLVNMYGITETTVHASYRRVRAADLAGTASLIGRPLPDLDFRLVDERLRPAEPGETGEIVVTGAGVALGYLGNPELTAARFVELPGPDGTAVRGYRSGDLARLTPDGEYEYLGRADDQVKIRGHRIELGEIHAALLDVPGVTRAAVIVRGARPRRNPVVKRDSDTGRILPVRSLVRAGREAAPDGRSQLVAYVVVDGTCDVAGIAERLRGQLPPYMVPAFVVPVADIPLTANGKADVALLPVPTAAEQLRQAAPAAGPAGTGADARTRALCGLFEEVLGIDGVSPDDSFFGVGGDSILAVRLRAAAEQRGIGLDLVDIYDLQTPRELAAVAGGDAEHTPTTVAPYSLIGDADRALLPDGVVDAYPLATLQAGVLFHSAYATGVNMYCDIFMFRLRARFDADAMARALDRVAARHEILRTSFHLSGYSEPLQLVHATARIPLTVHDLTGCPQEQQLAEFHAWREREMRVPYDWTRPPLVRFAAHVLGEDEFMLSMSFHDTMFDGWSETSLLAELFVDYWRDMAGVAGTVDMAGVTGTVDMAGVAGTVDMAGVAGTVDMAGVAGTVATPAPPVRRYADFIALEQAALRDEDTRKFWTHELTDVEPSMLPRLAQGSADVHEGRMGFLSVDLPADLSDRLHQLAAACRVSVKHVLLAVQARVVAVLTGRDEVVLGVASNGRVEEDGGTEVIGLHLNLVPYRLRPRGRTWRELIAAASDKERDLLPVRRFPHAEMLRLVGLGELTDIMFNYTHFHGYERVAQATDIEVLDGFGYIQTNFTLRAEFNKDPFSRVLTLDLEANLERVGEAQLDQIAELYQAAMRSAVAEPDREPTQVRLLGEPRYRELLEVSRGPVEPATASGFFERYERAVATYADDVAAECLGERITYRDLARRVEEVAGWLAGRGVARGTVVGLCAGRDIDYLVVLLAIMRVGGVYLPLPEGPAARVARMVRRARADFAICAADRRAALAQIDGLDLVDLAEVLAAPAQQRAPIGPAPAGRDSAYILFTSGSTGEPKGALIRHDGMLNHLDAKNGWLGLGPGDRLAQDAAATFDISVWQFIAPLMVGAATVIYPDEIGQDAVRLLRAVAEDGVTALEVTPSVLTVMNAELTYHGPGAFGPFALRWVASQAETLTPQCANTFRRLLPDCGLLNMWGTTEVSDDVLHHHVAADVDERTPSVPLGRPVRNTAVYVLDSARQPVPVGTPGELYVGGVCVGGGYVNDPRRTAEVFVADPYATEPGARMYRTGDRGRRLPDGSLEFLGRIDNQLKIRGNRIELEEVVRALAGVNGVQDSAVIVRDSASGGKQLVGFFVPQVVEGGSATEPAPAAAVARRDLTAEEVRARLTAVLPRFAVPDFLVRLDALPRTTHGKVDTRALAQVPLAEVAEADADSDAPMSPTEQAVAEVWAAVIQSGRPGPASNFFDLGGHSLHATQVLARLRDRFAVALPVRDLFEHPTVRGLAARIDAAVAAAGGAAEVPVPAREPGQREFPLSAAQSALWYLDQVDPSGSYVEGYLLRLRGDLDVDALRAAVDALARRHEVLSTRFGERDGVPYQLVDEAARLRLEVVDVPGGAALAGDPDAMTAHARQRAAGRRFDLRTGPLTVACLHRFAPDAHVLEWSSHHAVSDGWSNEVIVRELGELYLARLTGREPDLPDLPVQYGDHARWQERWLRCPAADRERDFWRSYLDGYPGELALATDVERTEDRSRATGRLERRWDAQLSSAVRAFARSADSTVFMVAHALGAVVAAKLAQQSDVVLGAAVAGRNLAETRGLVGFFANVVPFRYQVDLARTGRETVRDVRERALRALDHQNLPFQHIVDTVGAPRRLGVSPLVQVVVSVARPLTGLAGLPGTSADAVPVTAPTSRFDLLLHFTDDDPLGLTVEYDRSLFTEGTVARLAGAVRRLAAHLVAYPDRPVDEAVLVDDADRTALAQLWAQVSGEQLTIDRDALATMLASASWDAYVARVEAAGLLAALVLAL